MMYITLRLIKKKKEEKILGWMGWGGGPKVFDKNCQQFKVTIHVK